MRHAPWRRITWPLFVVSTAALVGAAILGLLLSRPGSSGVPEGLRNLPLFHAALNATSGVLLLTGFAFIRMRMKRAHMTCMILALGTTGLFLVSYLFYHFHAGSVRFQAEGWPRRLYFTILVSHTVLAAFVPPLAGTTLYRAARGRFDPHKKVARWTLPIWLYVSFSGVLVYLMLYVWFPGN